MLSEFEYATFRVDIWNDEPTLVNEEDTTPTVQGWDEILDELSRRGWDLVSVVPNMSVTIRHNGLPGEQVWRWRLFMRKPR